MLKIYKMQKQMLASMLLLFVFFSGFSQERKVSGRVADEGSAGMPGVNILVKGTATGTVSDSQGNFNINVPASDAVLVFSFVGYLTKEVPVGSQSNINVSLDPDVISLSEVVVTGYGSQSKRDITGAVSIVDSKKLLANPPVLPW